MAFIEEGHEKSGTSHHESDKDEKSPNAAETQLRLARLEAAADQGEDDEENGRRIRRIYRSVDLRLILTLAILYVWAYIDRGNLANVSDERSHSPWRKPQLTPGALPRPTLLE
jgi:hypothetical protein